MQRLPVQYQLFKEENFRLSAQTRQNGIKLIVKLVKNAFNNETYQSKLVILEKDQNLCRYFQQTQQLINHMKDSENIELDIERMTIKIFANLNTKRNKKVQLCQIILQLAKPNIKDKLQKIINYHEGQKQIDNNIIQKEIKILAQSLYYLLNQKQSKINVQQLYSQQLIEQNLQKSKFDYNVNQQLKKIREEINSFYKKVQQNVDIKLDQMQKRIRQQFSEHQRTKIIQQNATKIEQRLQKLEMKYPEQYSKMIQQVQQLGNKVSQDLGNKIIELSKIFATHEQTEAIIKKLKYLGKELQKLDQQIIKMKKVDLVKIQESFKINAIDWVDPECFGFQKILFNNNKITIKFGTFIFGKIQLKTQNSFCVTFTTIKQFFALGIIDNSYKKGSWGKNEISYHSDEKIYDGKQWKSHQGAKLKVGDQITVIVNFNLSTIQWKTGSRVCQYLKIPIIKDPKITWVPFIRMWNRDDSVIIHY